MKKILLILLMFIGHNLYSQKNEIYTIVEEMPYFGNCDGDRSQCFKNNFFPFVKDNLDYPKNQPTLFNKIRVYVKFIVNKKGTIENVTIEKSSGNEAYNLKAIDVINKLPQFSPGIQNGKKVNVQYLVPIDFFPEPVIDDYDMMEPMPKIQENETFTIVERMPLFGTCEEQKNNERFYYYYKEASKCSNRNIEAYLQDKVNKIRNQLPTGFFNTQIQFIVETDGSLSNEKVKISSGNEAVDNAALEIVKKMQYWEAGSQRAKPVRVQYIIPVNFK